MTDASRYAETWAENAIVTIATLAHGAYADWIVDNRDRLGECISYAPAAWDKVRIALADRAKELRAQIIRQGIG